MDGPCFRWLTQDRNPPAFAAASSLWVLQCAKAFQRSRMQPVLPESADVVQRRKTIKLETAHAHQAIWQNAIRGQRFQHRIGKTSFGLFLCGPPWHRVVEPAWEEPFGDNRLYQHFGDPMAPGVFAEPRQQQAVFPNIDRLVFLRAHPLRFLHRIRAPRSHLLLNDKIAGDREVGTIAIDERARRVAQQVHGGHIEAARQVARQQRAPGRGVAVCRKIGVDERVGQVEAGGREEFCLDPADLCSRQNIHGITE